MRVRKPLDKHRWLRVSSRSVFTSRPAVTRSIFRTHSARKKARAIGLSSTWMKSWLWITSRTCASLNPFVRILIYWIAEYVSKKGKASTTDSSKSGSSSFVSASSGSGKIRRMISSSAWIPSARNRTNTGIGLRTNGMPTCSVFSLRWRPNTTRRTWRVTGLRHEIEPYVSVFGSLSWF